MDNAVLIGAITTIAALAAPIVTTVINNSHENEKRKMDVHMVKKIEATESFIKATGKLIYAKRLDNYEEYGQHMNMLYLYYESKEIHKCLDNLYSYMSDEDFDKCGLIFNQLCKLLRSEFAKDA